MRGTLLSHGFQTVICDESHYLKNLQAVRTTMVCPLIEKARHAILLSGTPCLNRPVELYAQVSALSDSLERTAIIQENFVMQEGDALVGMCLDNQT